jgi:hypothetical protein
LELDWEKSRQKLEREKVKIVDWTLDRIGRDATRPLRLVPDITSMSDHEKVVLVDL